MAAPKNNKNKQGKRAIENSNCFLHRVWNVDLREHRMSTNQVFPNKNVGANERCVQIVKVRYTLKGPRKIYVKEFIFTIGADNSP